MLPPCTNKNKPSTPTIPPPPTYPLLLLRAFLLLNIALACRPLLRKADTCEDIPLTPAQRQLLNLPPLSRPATPQEKDQYITPPRYSRSATPNSSLRVAVSDSPLSGRSSTTPLDFRSPQRGSSGSPLTPSGAERRRLSYNNNNNPSSRSSPLSTSEFDAAGLLATPTKVGQRASVGLNNKWLYERGRGSSGARGSGSGSGGF